MISSDSHLFVCSFRVGAGQLEACLQPIQIELERFRINLQEKVSFVDNLVIIDRQNGQRPAHLGCHRNDIRGDVGVSRIDQNLGQKLKAEVKNQKSQKSPDHDMVLEPLEYSSRLHIFDQNRHQYRGTFIWYRRYSSPNLRSR